MRTFRPVVRFSAAFRSRTVPRFARRPNNPEATGEITTFPAGGGTTVSITRPDGGTEIRASYIDGQPKSVIGSSVSDTSFLYGTHTLFGRGLFTQTIRLTATGGTGEWTKIYQDALDRVVREEFPSDLNTNGVLDATNYLYHGPGAARGSRTKLQRVTDPDGKFTTVLYNTKGERSNVTEQMPASQSRVSAMAYDVVNDGTLGVSERVTTTTNGVVTSVHLRSGDGDSTRESSLGRVTTTIKTVSNATGDATVTTTLPDGTFQVRTLTGNLVTQTATLGTASAEIQSTAYTYDVLRRVASTIDSRTGATTINSYTDAGQPRSATEPGSRTTIYAYDTMGRRLSVDQPDTVDSAGSTLANITRTSYYPTGQVKAVWGDQTNAVLNLYDEQNRMAELRTYRTLAHNSEPTSSTAGADTTTWSYHPQRGFLTRKQYADAKGTDYAYTPAGQLKTRVWARGITTTYSYDKGLLTSTDYSDTTPDVLVTYDAFGRQQTISQTNQSLITYAYNPTTLALDTETIASDLDHDGTSDFTRVLDRSQDSILRDTGWQLKDGSTVENQVTYGYHPTHGRLSTVTGGGDISSPQSFTYEYTNNSNLIQSVTGPIHTVVNTWATDRDVLELKENKVGTTLISGFDYGVNSIGQRSGVTTAGTAFSGTPGWDWGYNARGEVVKADSSVTAHDRAYEYDAIGNRKKSADSLTLPGTDNYTSNALNQYSSIQQGGTGVSPVYDDDGNATAYPLPVAPGSNGTLMWDAENRLIASTVGSATTTYLYDSQSRRIAKTTGTATTVYLYDAWNPVGEYSYSPLATPHSALLRSYLWGTDLSGTFQGVGGVGGLLSMFDHRSLPTNRFFPTYDGNGNVSEYLASNGAVTAHFEYDPFGRAAVDSDTAGRFYHRFSTKPLDFETGLYYYGYRYYDSLTGRWLSRDPFEEKGGMNLFAFARNNSPNFIDVNGEWVVMLGAIAAVVAIIVTVIVELDDENDESNCDKEIKEFEKKCADKHKEAKRACSRKKGWQFSTTDETMSCEGNSRTVPCGGDCNCPT